MFPRVTPFKRHVSTKPQAQLTMAPLYQSYTLFTRAVVTLTNSFITHLFLPSYCETLNIRVCVVFVFLASPFTSPFTEDSASVE